MDIPKNQSWVSLHPLSSPLHLVLAKPLPAVDPDKGIEQEGILGGGVCFLLLSQQLWPKLFAIKQHVAASQESLLAHPRYMLATCSSKASSTPGASVSRAPRRASSLRGKQGKNSGQHRQADRCLLRRWLEDLEQSCHTSVSPAQTFSFCPGTSSQRKKKKVSHLSGMLKPPAAGLELELRVESRCPETW